MESSGEEVEREKKRKGGIERVRVCVGESE